MIPNKSNFKFQELTPITGVKPYVIRFWETEFPEISPIDSEGGQKLYSRADVEVILKVKKLLFEDKLSIPEAKLHLTNAVVDIKVAEKNRESSSGVKAILTEALEVIQDIKIKRNW